MSTPYRFLRVLPPPQSKTGAIASGTGSKVLMPDGSELPGVLKVQLVARPEKPWMLILECLVEPHQYPITLADRYQRSDDAQG